MIGYIIKLKYMDLGMEEIRYGQGDLRLRKEFKLMVIVVLMFHLVLGARTHPAYGFAPTVIDSSWYTSSWWEFASERIWCR